MNKHNFLLVTLFCLVFVESVKSENAGSKTVFNPTDVWEYGWVGYPYSEGIEDYGMSVARITLKSSGEATRKGRRYAMFECSMLPGGSSYMLVREDNGAYYAYIDPDEEFDDDYDLCGEHLLYDFNMEIGACYSAPCEYSLNLEEGAVVNLGMSFMADFVVVDKSVDEYGRRVLDLKCNSDCFYVPDEVIRVVEGVGPLSNGFLGIFSFMLQCVGHDTYDIIEFYRVTDSTGEEIYLNPNERKCGFVKEKEYEWVYAIQGASGSPEYWKMGFNHYCIIEYNNLYRRFTVKGVSDDPDGEWKEKSFKRFLVREQDGKIWLCHTPGLMNTDYLNRNPTEESLIYDFSAPDGSEIDILTPEGTQSVMVSAGISEIGGENVYSYRFNDSGDVECVEGIGIVKGGILPCVNTVFGMTSSNGEENYSSAVLVAVYDGEGRLIFSQDLPKGPDVAVPSINGFIAPEDRIFNMMGQELDAPLPGQPYIRGGKIRIEPK